MSHFATYALPSFGNVNTSAISITAVSVVNIGLLLWLGSRKAETENRQTALWAHGLWSGMWLAWLVAWLAVSAFPTRPSIAVVLEDIGAYSLIGSAVVRLWGQEGLRKYANISYLVFVLLDLVWPLLISYEWSRAGAAIDPFYRTVLYAPSLCLVIFAMGLFGWSQLQLEVNPVLRFTAAFAAGGYALFQVLIYQINLFTPGMPEGNSVLWRALMLNWRAFFVIVYWVELLAWVGIRLPAGPAREMASKLGWLPPVIVTVVLEHYLK
jgi:hypothetical protein